MSIAAPSPFRKSDESAKAPGGKSNARALLKCVTPETITQPIVSMTPTHKYSEMRPMIATFRYKRNTATRQVPIATKVAGAMVMLAFRKGRFVCQSVFDNEGNRNPAYCASPIQPEAIESGALNVNCQIKRKSMNY